MILLIVYVCDYVYAIRIITSTHYTAQSSKISSDFSDITQTLSTRVLPDVRDYIDYI